MPDIAPRRRAINMTRHAPRAVCTPGLKNAEMDRLIDALEVELNAEKRKTLWAEAQRLYATELPSLPLFFRSDSFILPKWLRGIRPTGNQYPTTLWITDWAVQP